MEKINIKTLWARFIAQTPVFWKKVQKRAAALGTLAFAIVQVGLDINPTITSALNYIVLACIIIVGTAQFTVEDKK